MQSAEQANIKQARAGESEAAFAEFLEAANNGQDPLPNYRDAPEVTFRFIYDVWVRRGGYEQGKPRHSVRQIKEWLGQDQVRSLETKLAGRTRLQHRDAFDLLRLFLSHWTYDKATDSYATYLDSDPEELTSAFIGSLLDGEADSLLLPERSRKSKSAAATTSSIKSHSHYSTVDETRQTGEFIRELFGISDALVTVSRSRAVIGRDQPVAMKGFHDLMLDLFEIDQRDRRKRTLIWVIDFGFRDDTVSSRQTINNFYFLVSQFRSIALIQRSGREALFNWLRENACIIVGSLLPDEIEHLYVEAALTLPEMPQELFWFQADRLFLESVPHRWLDAPGSGAFGLLQRELWLAPTITVHLKLDDWPVEDHKPEVDPRKNLRYLYHGEIPDPSHASTVQDVRAIRLPEPGRRWSNAHRLAIQAAMARLGRQYDSRVIDVEPHEALAALSRQSFAALRLDEFLRLPSTLVDQLGGHFERS